VVVFPEPAHALIRTLFRLICRILMARVCASDGGGRVIVASVRAVRKERGKFGRGNIGDDWRIPSWSDESSLE